MSENIEPRTAKTWDELSSPDTKPAKEKTWDELKTDIPEPSSALRRTVGDLGVTAGHAAVDLPEAAVGLADLVSGGRAGKAVQDAGVDFKRTHDILDTAYSPEQQKANAAVQQAEGFGSTLGAIAENPSVALHTVARSAPAMLGGLGVAKGIMKAAPKVAPLAAGAIGEGAITAGQGAEQVRQQGTTGLLTPKQSALIAGSGALTGGITAGAGRVASRLGIGDINTMGLGSTTDNVASKALPRRVLEEGALEGVQETAQSSQEQAAQNVALDRDIGQGVGNAAALGMVAGAGMGAPAGVFSGGKELTAPAEETSVTAQALPTEPENVQLPEEAQEPEQAAEPTISENAEASGEPPVPETTIETTAEPKAVDPRVKSFVDKYKERLDLGGIPTVVSRPLREAAIAAGTYDASDVPMEVFRKLHESIYPPIPPTPEEKVQSRVDSVTEELHAELDAAPVKGTLNTAAKAAVNAGLTPQQQEASQLQPEDDVANYPTPTVQTPTTILSNNVDEDGVQKPFSSWVTAWNYQHRGGSDLPATHKIVEFDGGFALEPITEADSAPQIESTTEQESGTSPQTQEITNGESKNSTTQEPTQEETRAAVTPDTPIDFAIAQEHPLVETNGYKPAETPAENKKAVVNFQDLPIAIENPAGSDRTGTDASGKEWKTTMQDHYGEILTSTGADEDAVDVFVPAGLNRAQIDATDRAYVIDQINPENGQFDEHKVMLGYPTKDAAAAAYQRNYNQNRELSGATEPEEWKGLGDITEMPIADFKTWVRSGNTKAPVGQIVAPPVQDRRQNTAPVSSDLRKGDRRVSNTGAMPSARRKQELELTKQKLEAAQRELEAANAAAMVNPLSGIPNDKAFYSQEVPKFVAFADGDSLKFVNDTAGHAAGDALLKNFASALRKHADAYHVSGDEYLARGNSEAELRAALEAAQAELASGDHVIVATNSQTGKTYEVRKPSFSFAIVDTSTIYGETPKERLHNAVKLADVNVAKEKELKVASGERPDRGEVPKNVFEILPSGEKKELKYHPKQVEKALRSVIDFARGDIEQLQGKDHVAARARILSELTGVASMDPTKATINALRNSLYQALHIQQGKPEAMRSEFMARLEELNTPQFSRRTEPEGEELPEAITIDGVERPTTNSNGQPIHATEEGVKNFWKWFGDSKVVDDQGRPLVVYHGTEARNLNAFESNRTSYRYLMLAEFKILTQGHFFSPSEADAEEYGGHVIPANLRISKPLIPLTEYSFTSKDPDTAKKIFTDYEYIFEPLIEDQDGVDAVDLMGEQYFEVSKEHRESGDWVNELADVQLHWAIFDNPEVVKRMRERGYDGAKVLEPNDSSGESWFVLDPNQIKSAIGNTGEFSPENTDIRFSTPAEESNMSETTNISSLYNGNRYATGKEAQADLVEQFGTGIDRLVSTGVLHFTQGKESWPEIAKNAARSGDEAVYLNGKAYIDLAATPKNRVASVVLHEIGEHFNLKRMLGTAGYTSLQNQIASRAKIPGSTAEKVWASVKKGYTGLEEGSEKFIAEVIAKLGEQQPNAGWFRRLVSQIKAFLMRYGLAKGFVTGTMTEENIHGLLRASLQSAAKGRVLNSPQLFSSAAMASRTSSELPKTITVDGVERPTTNSNGQPIHTTEEGVKNFWKWFANSRVKDAEGRPLVVYHGTGKNYGNRGEVISGDFDAFSPDLSGKSSKTGAPAGSFFFTDKADVANSYTVKYEGDFTTEYKEGGNIMPSYLKIELPLRVSGKGDNWRNIEYKKAWYDINELAQAAQDKGSYDGCIVSRVIDKGVGTVSSKTATTFIAFDPSQIKSAIGNTGEFNPENADIRFSRPTTEAFQERYQDWSEKVKDHYYNMSDKVFGQKLAFLSVRQMVEVAKDYLPGIKEYETGMQARRAKIDTWLHTANRVTDVWKSVPAIMKRKLSKVMHDSTLSDVDASQEWSGVKMDDGKYIAYTQAQLNGTYQKELEKRAETAGAVSHTRNSATFNTSEEATKFLNEITSLEQSQAQFRAGRYDDPNVGRKEAHTKAKAEFANLSPEAQKVYRDTNALHTTLQRERVRALEGRVTEAIADVATRSQMIADLRIRFESSSLAWYYAPLSRHGDYWFYGKDAKGQNWFRTFESAEGRQKAVAGFEKDGGTITGTGKSLKDMAGLGIQGGSDSFILEVKKILDEKLPSEQSAALQDDIYQMYLSTLPDISVRHNSMHRKGTLGFDEDAMRSFSSAMHHGASQLSNMIYGRQMDRVLQDAKAAVDTSSSQYQKENVQAEIEASERLIADWETLAAPNEIDALIAQAAEEGDEQEEKILRKAKDLIRRYGKLESVIDSVSAVENNQIRQKAILKAANLITDEKRSKAVDTIAELRRTYDAMVNVGSGPMDQVASFARQMGFIWMLGFGLSSGMVNMLQTPVVAIPVVSGKFGVKKTAAAFNQTYREFAKAASGLFHKDANGNYDMRDEDGNASITTILRNQQALASQQGNTERVRTIADELEAMTIFKEEGDISRTQTFDIIGIGREGYDYGGAMQDLSKKMGWMFHHGERANREITLLAAYRLAREDAIAKGFDSETAHENAIEYARTANNKAHGDYSAENAARIFRGWPAGIALQFKKYPQMMLYLWGKAATDMFNGWKAMPETTPQEEAAKQAAREQAKEAARTFSGLLLMQVSVAGAFGLPLAGALEVILNAIGNAASDDDEPWDVEREVRVGLTNLGGEKFATTMTKGVFNALTPMNVSDRMGLKDIMFREPLADLEGRDAATNYISQIAGPTGGLVGKMFEGSKLLMDGQPLRAAEQAAPKFLGDAVKSARFFSEDARAMNGDKLKDMSAMETLLQLGGFGSSNLERKYAERGFAKQAEAAANEYRQRVINDIVRAKQEGKTPDLDAKEKWNAKHPDWKITGDTIAKSIRARKAAETAKGDRGYSVNKKMEYLYDEYRLEDED